MIIKKNRCLNINRNLILEIKKNVLMINHKYFYYFTWNDHLFQYIYIYTYIRVTHVRMHATAFTLHYSSGTLFPNIIYQ